MTLPAIQMLREKPTGLALLREPFPAHQISKLPKETRAQIEERKKDRSAGINCTVCGGWHHKRAIHLDYVGHAALTDRLLDADPGWSWEPMSMQDGLPAFDQSGGLWIRLTVCGVSRIGYGHAASKDSQDPGAREKEVIGDALRNAAMRFGAALELWHKGDLHIDDEPQKPAAVAPVSIPGSLANQQAAAELSPDERDVIDRASQQIIAAAKTDTARATQIMRDLCDSADDPNETKKALWAVLDSGTRAALKKHAEGAKS